MRNGIAIAWRSWPRRVLRSGHVYEYYWRLVIVILELVTYKGEWQRDSFNSQAPHSLNWKFR